MGGGAHGAVRPAGAEADVAEGAAAAAALVENNYFTEMCSGSEAGSYLRLIDFVSHSTLGLGVIKKRRRAALVDQVMSYQRETAIRM